MAVFSTYNEVRRVMTVSKGMIDLALDVFIARLYRARGLRKRSFGKRLLAGFIRRILRRQKTAAGFPVQFRRTLERLGPTYVKLGQILSVREDMLPERITKELTKLQTAVPPISFYEVKQVIEDEFNRPLSSIFKEFSPEPMAAASLAQAHEAKLKKGQKVVVKVQRPGIVRLILDDINVMRRMAAILERLPGLREYRPAHFVEEFASYTMRELDFSEEGKHADEFRENFKDDPQIVFPEIYWDYTSRKVLTMEFLDGIRPDEKEKIRKRRINGKKLAAAGANAVLKMLFVDGFFHGDPHPGNMLLIGRSKIGLIDLGMIGRFSPETRHNMFLYFYFMVIKEYEHATRYLVNLTEPGPQADIRGFREELAEAIKDWSGANFKEYSLGRLIFETMNIGARHQLYFHGDLVLSSKAIITIEAVGAILDPEMDISEVSRPMMQQIFIDQFSPGRVGRALLNAIPDYMDFMEQLPRNILNVYSMISSGKLHINVDEPSLDEERTESGRSVHSVLAASSLLGGTFFALSTNPPGPIISSIPALAGMPVIGATLFALAGVFYLTGRYFKAQKQ